HVSSLTADDAKTTRKSAISIQLHQSTEKNSKSKFVLTGLFEKDLEKLTRSHWKQEQWTALFFVCVDNTPTKEKSELPPVIGSYRIESNALIFEPRFPLAPGVRFRAVFEPARLPRSDKT